MLEKAALKRMLSWHLGTKVAEVLNRWPSLAAGLCCRMGCSAAVAVETPL